MSFTINRVYTRSGDKGDTGLVGGRRVRKTDPRVVAYGDVDELNSSLGVLKELLPKNSKSLVETLEFLQQELFDLGAELATPRSEIPEQMTMISEQHVARLEGLCDSFSKDLDELPSFILPGGSPAAAAAHMCRTIARRAERSIIAFHDRLADEEKNLQQMVYLNRFSDLMFILARFVLKAEGKEAPLWKQDKNRQLPST